MLKAESVLLDAEGALVAAALAIARDHADLGRRECSCRVCRTADAYCVALAAWSESGGKLVERRPRPSLHLRRKVS